MESGQAEDTGAAGASPAGWEERIVMSAVAVVVLFVCCALIIRALGAREQARARQAVVVEANHARR